MRFLKGVTCWGVGFLLFCFVCCSQVFAEPFFDPNDKHLTVEYTTENYYLNSLVGEDEYFADDFYDDYLLSLEGKRIVHFTKRDNEVIDFYFYVEDPDNLKIIHNFFEAHKDEVDKISPKIIPAFIAYQKLVTPYVRDDIYGKVSKIITEAAKIDVEPVLTEHSRRKLDNALYQYLRSNGIRALKDIPKNHELLKIMVDKFYMLSTTCFYRAWDAIEAARPYILSAAAQAKAANRPLKVKVFAASTGEEVMTYAVELFESGISDFRILASDINDSSLRFASAMHYSKASFDQLSLSAQDKLKKYFKLNQKLGFWEPIDPDMFKQRIKFINQDILKSLPADLGQDYSGPYDVISILNVLMYLDDPAIQKQKDYWVSILNPLGGVLILHDKMYSILRRKLGDKWSVDNFLLIDDWVNIRDTRLSAKDKIDFYERGYSGDADVSLIRLNNAYMFSGMSQKARTLCEEYVAKKPFSFVGLYLLLEHYIAENKPDKARSIADRLAHVYVFPERIIDTVAGLQDNRNEFMFLQDLKKEYNSFLDTYKKKIPKYESIFDNLSGRSKEWDMLRMVLKTSAYGYLQRYYLKENDIPNAEAISDSCIKLVSTIAKSQKQYYIAARFLDEIMRDLAYYYVTKGEYTKLYDFCSRVARVFYEDYSGVDYVFVYDAEGFANLNKAIALDQRKDYSDDFFTSLKRAIERYHKVLPQEENMGQSNLRGVHQELGHCHMLLGKAYFYNNDNNRGTEEWNRALGFFEAGISMDPVYSREILKLRKVLFELAARKNINLQPKTEQ